MQTEKLQKERITKHIISRRSHGVTGPAEQAARNCRGLVKKGFD